MLLHVLAVIPFRAGQTEKAFLEDRVGAVPKRQPEAEAALPIADPEQTVLAPPVGAAARMLVREVVPAGPIRGVVLAHGAPLPLREVGTESLPVALATRVLFQSIQFSLGARSAGRSILVLHAGPYAGAPGRLHVAKGRDHL